MQEKKFPDLFAFDLDGTLVHSDSFGERIISPDLIETLFELSKKAHVVAATGRRYRAAVPDLKKLPPMPYSIVHNGLVIKDASAKTIYAKDLKSETAFQIGELLEEEGFDPFFVSDGHTHEVDYTFTADSYERSIHVKKISLRPSQSSRVLKNLAEVFSLEFPILEVATLGTYEDLDQLRKKLDPQLPGGVKSVLVRNIGTSGIAALEIFDRDSSKWSAVEKVKEMLGATRVIAVGDDGNDFEMLKFADMGVVMSHADDFLKEVSKKEVHGSQGLHDFLREYLDS